MELAYQGTAFYGWQKQPNQISLQETIEDALMTILGGIIEVTGCGRTDTGVHALQYYCHFNYAEPFPPNFWRRINKFLPPDIAIRRILPVHWDAHTRFDAYQRSYVYHLSFQKDPFNQHTVYQYNFTNKPDFDRMQQAAQLLLGYEAFFPFCKSNNNARSMICEMKHSYWEQRTDEHWVYHISANRFLRGMVRLIVGMCINVGLGKTELEEVRHAMDQQQRLKRSTSAAPEGLYLCDIRYPYFDDEGNYLPPRLSQTRTSDDKATGAGNHK